MVRRYCRLQKAKNSDFFKLDLAKQIEQLSLVKLDEVDKIKPLVAQLVDVFDENTYTNTIDYHYFYKQKLNKDEVSQFLRAINLENIAEKFRKYVTIHSNAFTCYDAKEIAIYSKNCMLTFENETINYDPANFIQVINELEEENLPMSKGLIVQKLTEKQNSKKLLNRLSNLFKCVKIILSSLKILLWPVGEVAQHARLSSSYSRVRTPYRLPNCLIGELKGSLFLKKMFAF